MGRVLFPSKVQVERLLSSLFSRTESKLWHKIAFKILCPKFPFKIRNSLEPKKDKFTKTLLSKLGRKEPNFWKKNAKRN